MFGRQNKDPRPASEARPGFFGRLRARLNRGNSWLTRDLGELLREHAIDAQILEELETRLLAADVGVEATEHILADLKRAWRATSSPTSVR